MRRSFKHADSGEQNDNLAKKFVAVVTLLFPALSIYMITSSGFTLGDIFLTVALVVVAVDSFRNKQKIKFVTPLVIYPLTLLLLSVIHWATGIESLRTGFFSIARYAYYLLFCAIVSKNYLNRDLFFKYYKRIAIAISIYLLLQFISYTIARIILPSNPLSILGFKSTQEITWYNTIQRYISSSTVYRPCGIFAEPAHYATYQAPLIYLLLNDKIEKNKKRKISFVLVSTIGILLSGSTTGILILLFAYARSISSLFTKNLAMAILGIIVCIAGGTIFANSNYGKSIADRIFLDESYGAVEGRFSAIDRNISNKQNILIGNGMGYDSDGYLPSFPKMYLSYGVLGIAALLIMVMSTFSIVNHTGKKLTILWMITAVGTLSVFGIAIFIYPPLIHLNSKERDKENVNQ